MTELGAGFRIALLVVAALLPIVNPLGTAPIFLSMTAGGSRAAREILAQRIAVNGLLLLVASLFMGCHVLDFFGISLPVVQVGGGLVLVATGWRLLDQSDQPAAPAETATSSDEQLVRQAFYPLTLPITVGPGSIAVAIALGANTRAHGAWLVTVVSAELIGVTVVALAVYLCFRFAEPMAKLLGETGTSVIVRLSSFILLCIGVQIVWNGVSTLLTTLLSAAGRG
jgi:multiple antibiotic resistance protein